MTAILLRYIMRSMWILAFETVGVIGVLPENVGSKTRPIRSHPDMSAPTVRQANRMSGLARKSISRSVLLPIGERVRFFVTYPQRGRNSALLLFPTGHPAQSLGPVYRIHTNQYFRSPTVRPRQKTRPGCRRR